MLSFCGRVSDFVSQRIGAGEEFFVRQGRIDVFIFRFPTYVGGNLRQQSDGIQMTLCFHNAEPHLGKLFDGILHVLDALKIGMPSDVAPVDFLFLGVAFDDVAILVSSCRSAARDPLRFSHAALLSFPPTVMEADRYVICRLSFDENLGKLIAHEEDVIQNLQHPDNWVQRHKPKMNHAYGKATLHPAISLTHRKAPRGYPTDHTSCVDSYNKRASDPICVLDDPHFCWKC